MEGVTTAATSPGSGTGTTSTNNNRGGPVVGVVVPASPPSQPAAALTIMPVLQAHQLNRDRDKRNSIAGIISIITRCNFNPFISVNNNAERTP